MKTVFKKQMRTLFLSTLLTSLFCSSHLFAGNVGSVGVMDPESAGDEATIMRVKAKILLAQENEDGSKTIEDGDESITYIGEDGLVSSGGCGDINVGNIKTEVGASAPSSNIVIIEGPVVQENNCL